MYLTLTQPEKVVAAFLNNNNRSDLLLAGMWFLGAALLYFLTRSVSLDEYDSINLALGVGEFNLSAHQPHPPGAPVFIFLGKLLHASGMSIENALIALSSIGGGLLVASGFFVVAKLHSRALGFWFALCLALLPGVWMTAGKAMTDTLGIGLMLMSAAFIVAAEHDPDRAPRLAMAAVVIAALAIGVRPTLAPLQLLILLYGLTLKLTWRSRLYSAVLFGIVCLCWLVPTIISQAQLPDNQHGLLNFFYQLKAFKELSTSIAVWHYDFQQLSLDYTLKQLAKHLGGMGYFGMGLNVWYPEAVDTYLARIQTSLTPWDPSLQKWSVAGTLVFILFAVGWVKALYSLRKCRPSGFMVFASVWSLIAFVYAFLSVPPLMRYYIPVFPALLLPPLFAFYQSRYRHAILPLFCGLVLFNTMGLAHNQHTRFAPPVELLRALDDTLEQQSLDRSNVVLFLNAAVRRHAEWYAPDLQLLEGEITMETLENLPDDALIFTNMRIAEPAFSVRLERVSEHYRNLRVWMRHNHVELYRVELVKGSVS
ncbi:MAG TPA: hypothetical protein DD979_00580 [Gammaproteobacteria bacterium]|nr:hypothetical protein [Gammaproteobacteria bacterium]